MPDEAPRAISPAAVAAMWPGLRPAPSDRAMTWPAETIDSAARMVTTGRIRWDAADRARPVRTVAIPMATASAAAARRSVARTSHRIWEGGTVPGRSADAVDSPGDPSGAVRCARGPGGTGDPRQRHFETLDVTGRHRIRCVLATRGVSGRRGAG